MSTRVSTINSAGVIWSFAVGTLNDASDDDEDLSERFISASCRRFDDDDDDDDLSVNVEDLMDPCPPTPVTASHHDQEESLQLGDLMNKSEASIRSHDTSRSSKSSTYLREWDEVRMAPSTLLGKMMPAKLQRAREIVAQRKQSNSSFRLNKSEARLQLDSSIHNFESTSDLPALGLSSTSNHTSATSAASSMSSILVDSSHERPDSNKELSSILSPTKSDKKKKKKSSSRSKSPKPTKESKRISKDETTSKRRGKKPAAKQETDALDISHPPKTKKSKSRERPRNGQKRQPRRSRPHKRASV